MSYFVIFKDRVVDSASKLLSAMLPVITIGMLGMRGLLWISVTIGVFSLGVMITRSVLILKKKTAVSDSSAFAKVVWNLLGLPYALALSSLILMVNGMDASMGLWLAGLLVAGELVTLLPAKGDER